VPKRRIGVVLANLGTPDGTDNASVRRYLKEFLSDRASSR
jgi:ferrochelatase